jgi:adenylate kinase
VVRVLLLAPPGAGKGTQGTLLAERYGVPHLSTGDMLRDEVSRGTEAGLEAKGFMDKGELVPDRLVTGMITDRITGPDATDGFVLDGFPRNTTQAEAAYNWAKGRGKTFHAAISLLVPEDELVKRLVERGRQSGRVDDTEATIRNRLRVYAENTAPLKDYYRNRGILFEVDGTGAVDEVAERINAALAKVTT